MTSRDLWHKYKKRGKDFSASKKDAETANAGKVRESRNISTTEENLSTTEGNIEEKEKQIQELERQLSQERLNLSSHQKSLIRHKEKHIEHNIDLENHNEKSSQIYADITIIRKEYIDAMRGKKYPRGLKLLPPSPAHTDNLSGNVKLNSLGDIHGWTPGLINWLYEKKLAKCMIAGNILNAEMNPIEDTVYRRYFPDEKKNYSPCIHGLPSWPNGSPYFTDYDMPTQIHSIDLEWTGGANDIFIQIGDMIDRADHSETVLELMRRLVWNANGSGFALIGNHEHRVLTNDYEGWERDEKKSAYTVRGPGHHRFHISRNTYDGVPTENDTETIDKLRRNCFKSLRAHLSHFLLTQELAIRNSLKPDSLRRWKELTGPALEGTGLSDSDHLEIVTSRGWQGLQRSLDWFEDLPKGVILPGALACMIVEDTVFTHAEPSGLAEIEDNHFAALKEKFSFKKGFSAGILLLRLPSEGERDPLWELMWNRDTWKNAASPDLKEGALDSLVSIVSKLKPLSVSRFVHGHSTRKRQQGEDSPAPLSHNSEGVEVVNIDEAMTPHYLHDSGFHMPYKLDRVPKGWSSPSKCSKCGSTKLDEDPKGKNSGKIVCENCNTVLDET